MSHLLISRHFDVWIMSYLLISRRFYWPHKGVMSTFRRNRGFWYRMKAQAFFAISGQNVNICYRNEEKWLYWSSSSNLSRCAKALCPFHSSTKVLSPAVNLLPRYCRGALKFGWRWTSAECLTKGFGSVWLGHASTFRRTSVIIRFRFRIHRLQFALGSCTGA